MKLIPQFSDWSDFVNLSERVLLTDPCYKPGTWCSTEMSIKSGDWKACGFFPVDLRFVEYVYRQMEEVKEYKNETKIKIKRIFDKYNIDVDYDNLLEHRMEQIKTFNEKDIADVITYAFQLKSTPGFFDSDVIKHFNEGRVQRHCSSMFMVHKDYQDDDRFSQKNIHKTFKYVKPTMHNSLVDSGQIGIFDLEKYNKNYNKEFYKNCCDTYGLDKKGPEYYSQYLNSKYYPYVPVHKDINGFNIGTYYGDMPFKLKTISDETGIIAIMINTKRFDMTQLKVGDKVELKETSKLNIGSTNNPINTIETIIKVRESSQCGLPLVIKWSNGHKNTYDPWRSLSDIRILKGALYDRF